MDGPSFRDRREAGRALGQALAALALDAPVVLALPRGGVPVAYEVALALDAPLDLMLVRKLGAPGQAEYGLGAVTDGNTPQTVLNQDAIALLRVDPAYIESETRRQLAELERRRKIYLGDRGPVETAGRTVILVDDGIATGGTAEAALKALRLGDAARIVLAVPLAPRPVLADLEGHADYIVCLRTPEPFSAVGLHYQDFTQTSDDEVVELLEAARARR